MTETIATGHIPDHGQGHGLGIGTADHGQELSQGLGHGLEHRDGHGRTQGPDPGHGHDRGHRDEGPGHEVLVPGQGLGPETATIQGPLMTATTPDTHRRAIGLRGHRGHHFPGELTTRGQDHGVEPMTPDLDREVVAQPLALPVAG